MYKGKILLHFELKFLSFTRTQINREERALTQVMTWLDFLNFYFFFSLTFTLLVEEISISSDSPSSNNDCIKHIIFSSSWVCGAKEKMCEQVYILLSYFCSTLKYEKQFSSSYIIMYLTPRWLQCRAKNEWDEWEDI